MLPQLWKLRCHWLKDLRQRQIAVVANTAVDNATIIAIQINQVKFDMVGDENGLWALILSINYSGNLFSNYGMWCLKTLRAPLVWVGYKWSGSWLWVPFLLKSIIFVLVIIRRARFCNFWYAIPLKAPICNSKLEARKNHTSISWLNGQASFKPVHYD